MWVRRWLRGGAAHDAPHSKRPSHQESPEKQNSNQLLHGFAGCQRCTLNHAHVLGAESNRQSTWCWSCLVVDAGHLRRSPHSAVLSSLRCSRRECGTRPTRPSCRLPHPPHPLPRASHPTPPRWSPPPSNSPMRRRIQARLPLPDRTLLEVLPKLSPLLGRPGRGDAPP